MAQPISEHIPPSDHWLQLISCLGTDIQKAALHSRRQKARPWISRSMGLAFRSSAQCGEITVFTLWTLMGRNPHPWMGLPVAIFSIKLYSRIILWKMEHIPWFWTTYREILLISTMWVINSTSGLEQHDSINFTQVTITTQVGNDTEDLIVNTFQNTHPFFLYTPESDWYTPNSVSSFSGASGQ